MKGFHAVVAMVYFVLWFPRIFRKTGEICCVARRVYSVYFKMRDGQVSQSFKRQGALAKAQCHDPRYSSFSFLFDFMTAECQFLLYSSPLLQYSSCFNFLVDVALAWVRRRGAFYEQGCFGGAGGSSLRPFWTSYLGLNFISRFNYGQAGGLRTGECHEEQFASSARSQPCSYFVLFLDNFGRKILSREQAGPNSTYF